MNEAKISRNEAVKLINTQLEDSPPDLREKGEYSHYGRQELKTLVDAIYGTPKEGDTVISPTDESRHKYPSTLAYCQAIDSTLAVIK